jgi:hypothetical protein
MVSGFDRALQEDCLTPEKIPGRIDYTRLFPENSRRPTIERNGSG